MPHLIKGVTSHTSLIHQYMFSSLFYFYLLSYISNIFLPWYLENYLHATEKECYIFYESLPIAEDPTTLSARTIRLGGSLPGHHHLPADRDPSAGDPADQSQAGKAGASYHCWRLDWHHHLPADRDPSAGDQEVQAWRAGIGDFSCRHILHLLAKRENL